MRIKKKAIIVCAAALFLLTGVLMLRGKPGLQEGSTGSASPGYIFESVTGSVIEPQQKITAGLKTNSGTAVAAATEKAGKTAVPKTHSTKKKKAVTSPKPDKRKRAAVTRQPSTRQPVPSTKPATATPVPEEKNQVTLTIECIKILDHKELWKEGIEEIIPDQGIFYSGRCAFTEGETAYDLIKRICKAKNIALDSQYTPAYGTYYIRGIGNLYEFDCGSESGWQYSVNTKMPDTACSSYQLHNGDSIVFYYDYKW